MNCFWACEERKKPQENTMPLSKDYGVRAIRPSPAHCLLKGLIKRCGIVRTSVGDESEKEEMNREKVMVTRERR